MGEGKIFFFDNFGSRGEVLRVSKVCMPEARASEEKHGRMQIYGLG